METSSRRHRAVNLPGFTASMEMVLSNFAQAWNGFVCWLLGSVPPAAPSAKPAAKDDTPKPIEMIPPAFF